MTWVGDLKYALVDFSITELKIAVLRLNSNKKY